MGGITSDQLRSNELVVHGQNGPGTIKKNIFALPDYSVYTNRPINTIP
jgi:hypothetical protein